ncbi:MAG TPA: hypothetical protein VL860_09360, partial [Planctomycetota bacterium]|nr:hypothetical protein [Planctomycetota bacterium]
ADPDEAPLFEAAGEALGLEPELATTELAADPADPTADADVADRPAAAGYALDEIEPGLAMAAEIAPAYGAPASPAASIPPPGSGPLLCSLAKKEELVYTVGHREGLRLSRRNPGLRLLQYVRDEAHRFARHYHHILRKKLVMGDIKKV